MLLQSKFHGFHILVMSENVVCQVPGLASGTLRFVNVAVIDYLPHNVSNFSFMTIRERSLLPPK